MVAEANLREARGQERLEEVLIAVPAGEETIPADGLFILIGANR